MAKPERPNTIDALELLAARCRALSEATNLPLAGIRAVVPAPLLFAFFLFLSVEVSLAQGGVTTTQLSGRWASTEHVTFTNPTLAGSSFFLDIAIAEDGTFQGTWDAYSCISYPGAYATPIISCSRTKRPEKVRGKFNLAAQGGEIVLDKLGRTSFKYSLGTELLLNLPKDWLKQGDPVLYASKLARPSK